VKVIKKKTILDAIKDHPEWDGALRAWYKIVKKEKWSNFPEIRLTFNTVSLVGTCIVFNIGGNKCRLVSCIHFAAKKFYILHILTHAEYDRGGWKNDCDCD